MKYDTIPEATVIINPWNSECNACGMSCWYIENSHEKVLGYGSTDKPGCGIVWTHVSTGYVGDLMERMASGCRPDLEFVPLFPDLGNE